MYITRSSSSIIIIIIIIQMKTGNNLIKTC